MVKFLFTLFTIGLLMTGVFAQRFTLPDEIAEASGLSVISDTLYWINDSGNESQIFVTDKKGNLLEKFDLDFSNEDWEDLTVDEKRRFYIGDVGNNDNKRMEFQVYRCDRKENVVDTFRYFYGSQREFPPQRGFQIYDAEAIVYSRDTIHIFSKSKMGNKDIAVYRYELLPDQGLQELWPIDTFDMGEWLVTGAAIHPTGKVLALLSYRYLIPRFWFPSSEILLTIFYDYPGNDFFKGKVITRRIPSWFFASQYECIDWLDEKRLLIGSERTRFIRQKAKVVKLKKSELRVLEIETGL